MCDTLCVSEKNSTGNDEYKDLYKLENWSEFLFLNTAKEIKIEILFHKK